MENNTTPAEDFLSMDEDLQVDYYKIERMSNSAMSHFKRSPLHYNFYKNFKQEPTPAMIFGNAFHTLILEPDKFDKRYCTVPDDSPRRPSSIQRNAKKPSPETLISIAFWDEFNAANQDKIILSASDNEKLLLMQNALFAHEPSMEYLNELQEVEKEFLWNDDITGIEMKGKLDGVHSDFTIDLKTCMTAEPGTFSNIAFNSAYHRQAALYMDARGLNKMNKGDFFFIAIEKEPPFGISVMKCGRDFIEHGRFVYGQILEDFQYWNQMGRPNVGYEWKAPIGYHNLNLPNWMK